MDTSSLDEKNETQTKVSRTKKESKRKLKIAGSKKLGDWNMDGKLTKQTFYVWRSMDFDQYVLSEIQSMFTLERKSKL